MRAAKAVLFLSGGMLSVFRGAPGAVVFWCARVLPALRRGQAALSGRLSLPLAEALLIGSLFWLLGGALRRRRGRLLALSAALCLAVSCTWFPLCMVNAGASTGSTLDADALAGLCARLAAEASSLRRGLPEDTRGRVLLPYSQGDLLREAARLCGGETVPKASRLSGLLAALGVSGWWSPITAEAIVDCTLPAAALPFTLCHELAHAGGVTGEAEANLFAREMCRRGDASFRYSGAVSALWYAMGALRDADETAWQRAIDALDAPVLRDFRAMNGLSTREEGPLEHLQDALTDVYLYLTGASDYGAFVAWLA